MKVMEVVGEEVGVAVVGVVEAASEAVAVEIHEEEEGEHLLSELKCIPYCFISWIKLLQFK